MKVTTETVQPLTYDQIAKLTPVEPANPPINSPEHSAMEAAMRRGSPGPSPLDLLPNGTSTTHGKNGEPELPAIMGTTSTDDVSDAAGKRLSHRDLMVQHLRNIRDRLEAYAEQTTNRKILFDSLMTTAQGLDLAIAGAATLPPDWKPVRPAASTARKAGDHVTIKSKHRDVYKDDLTTEDMDNMVIMRVGEKRLRCHCVASGATIFVPAGHVESK